MSILRTQYSLTARERSISGPQEVFYLNQMQPKELREKYLSMKDDFMSLKKFTRKQEEQIMRLQTKLRKIIEDEKQNQRITTDRFKIADLQEQIEDLQKANATMENKNSSLTAKLKVANVQLLSSRKNRSSIMYRNVSSRVNCGQKRVRKSKSLTNLTRAEEPWRPRIRHLEERQESLDTEITSQKSSDHAEENREIEFVLKEARKRIIELEEDEERLVQHLQEFQQSAEETENDLHNRIASLTNDLEITRETIHRLETKEKEDNRSLIRVNRELKASTHKMKSFQDTMANLQKEIAQRDRLSADLESCQNSMELTTNELKEVQNKNNRLTSELNDLTTQLRLLQKQNKHLQMENEKLMNIDIPTPQVNYVTNTTEKIRISELEKLLKLSSEEKSQHMEKIRELEDMVSTKDKEIQNVRADMEKTTSLLHEAKASLDKLTQHGLYQASDLENLLKTLRQGPQRDDTINAEKCMLKLDNLEQKYNQLQLLYREKKLELTETSSLLASHSETYEKLKKQVKDLRKVNSEMEDLSNKRILKLSRKLDQKTNQCAELEEKLKYSFKLKEQSISKVANENNNPKTSDRINTSRLKSKVSENFNEIIGIPKTPIPKPRCRRQFINSESEMNEKANSDCSILSESRSEQKKSEASSRSSRKESCRTNSRESEKQNAKLDIDNLAAKDLNVSEHGKNESHSDISYEGSANSDLVSEELTELHPQPDEESIDTEVSTSQSEEIEESSLDENEKILYLEIVGIKLAENSDILKDPKIKFLFVDYHGFLGLPPDELETPESLPKPKNSAPLFFNFGKEIDVTPKKYPDRWMALQNMIQNKSHLCFTLTSEPPEELQDDEDCKDLGHSNFNIGETLSKKLNFQDQGIPIISNEDETTIGTIFLTMNFESQ